jgi:sugar phosphate isomerase/epimerase
VTRAGGAASGSAPGARPLIALSTASVFPEPLTYAFEIAARLGYDGVELMPLGDPASQDLETVRRLSDAHGVPVLSVHAPCLLVTQRVWGVNPWRKLVKARRVAEALGASTVVVHPPFRWQRDYARRFVTGLEQLGQVTDVRFAVENMYPWTARRRELAAYLPDWDPRSEDYPHVTLDLSHTSASGSDAVTMLTDLGSRMTHLHLADGTGLPGRDEHLVPGRGRQPCAEVLHTLAAQGFDGVVVVEISTRKARSREERENDLADALGFARRHLDAHVQDLR